MKDKGERTERAVEQTATHLEINVRDVEYMCDAIVRCTCNVCNWCTLTCHTYKYTNAYHSLIVVILGAGCYRVYTVGEMRREPGDTAYVYPIADGLIDIHMHIIRPR